MMDLYRIKVKAVLELEAEFAGSGGRGRTPEAVSGCLKESLKNEGWDVYDIDVTIMEVRPPRD